METVSVLLVDDDEAANFLNRHVLQQNIPALQVDEALDGSMAIEKLNSQTLCPDLIFLDLNMPQMDGFTFLKEYEKQDRCCKHSRVVVLTSSQREEDRRIAMAYKCVTAYVEKPLTPEVVKAAVNSVSK